ncbi:MAG: hypothetical protein IJO46_06370, partial [Thermoguttaceae bacterium]|nr:hypothetical protein [Thermoguttaceae bacterium]
MRLRETTGAEKNNNGAKLNDAASQNVASFFIVVGEISVASFFIVVGEISVAAKRRRRTSTLRDDDRVNDDAEVALVRF